MLEPKTFGSLLLTPQTSYPSLLDWSDSRSDTGYETQLGTFLFKKRKFIDSPLENLKKKDSCLDTTKQYSENASTSEEGSSVASPWISSSSKFSSHCKSSKIFCEEILILTMSSS